MRRAFHAACSNPLFRLAEFWHAPVPGLA